MQVLLYRHAHIEISLSRKCDRPSTPPIKTCLEGFDISKQGWVHSDDEVSPALFRHLVLDRCPHGSSCKELHKERKGASFVGPGQYEEKTRQTPLPNRMISLCICRQHHKGKTCQRHGLRLRCSGGRPMGPMSEGPTCTQP